MSTFSVVSSRSLSEAAEIILVSSKPLLVPPSYSMVATARSRRAVNPAPGTT
jgi:hypothetical protein